MDISATTAMANGTPTSVPTAIIFRLSAESFQGKPLLESAEEQDVDADSVDCILLVLDGELADIRLIVEDETTAVNTVPDSEADIGIFVVTVTMEADAGMFIVASCQLRNTMLPLTLKLLDGQPSGLHVHLQVEKYHIGAPFVVATTTHSG